MSDTFSAEERELALRAKFNKMADEWFEAKSKEVKEKKKEEHEEDPPKPRRQAPAQTEEKQGLLQALLFGR